jgi:CheY-like chemotaxis protein
MSDDPLQVLGSRGQLEQVFLDLMVRAEQCLTDSAEKLITLQTTRLGRRALVEISYSGTRDGADPFSEAEERSGSTLGLGVCRSVISGHGGEMRAIQPHNGDPRFEVELPWAGREEMKPAREAGERPASQPLTALVMEPDEPVQRHLLALLTARGYRVVPVQNSDSGLDLAQRMRFDVAFCSVRSPGLNWVELSERMQSRVGGFALMSDGYDPELAADFEGDGRFVLTKPIDEHQLDRVLQRVVKPVPKRPVAG